jgi:hypothetical protein
MTFILNIAETYSDTKKSFEHLSAMALGRETSTRETSTRWSVDSTEKRTAKTVGSSLQILSTVWACYNFCSLVSSARNVRTLSLDSKTLLNTYLLLDKTSTANYISKIGKGLLVNPNLKIYKNVLLSLFANVIFHKYLPYNKVLSAAEGMKLSIREKALLALPSIARVISSI